MHGLYSLGVIRIIVEIGINSYYTLGFIDGQLNVTNNLNISYTYHKHVDGEGNIANKEYLAILGGCYTKYSAVSESISVCVNECSYDSDRRQWNSWGNCPRCGRIWTGVQSSTGVWVSHSHNIGYYYLLNCGKTTDTVESATIIY